MGALIAALRREVEGDALTGEGLEGTKSGSELVLDPEIVLERGSDEGSDTRERGNGEPFMTGLADVVPPDMFLDRRSKFRFGLNLFFPRGSLTLGL